MTDVARKAIRTVRAALMLLGGVALLLVAAQFTNLPWRAYRSLARVEVPFTGPPSHILLMGGSGIPGESALMRTYYAAYAAAQHPAAEVLVALPRAAAQSDASRNYLDELRLRGAAPERLRILADGNNTREQALRLAAELGQWTNGRPRVLIVTSPEHVRRTAASIRRTCQAELAALPAFPLSLEDPDLTPRVAPGPHRSAEAAPAGFGVHIRYNLWANLRYSCDALREGAALLYYRLRGWI